MPDADLPQIARESEVTFKSKLGYTYEGTVTAGPDADDCYTVVTADGATALVARSDLKIKGAPSEGDDDPNLTPAQRASLRAERGRTAATSRVTDAMQTVFVTLREDAKRELGEDPEGDALDDLRLQAADLVVAEAEELRRGLTRQVDAKRTAAPTS
jgi:hypothetical protein